MSGKKLCPSAPMAVSAHQKPKSWADLEAQVAAWAAFHGEQPNAALRELRRGGSLARLICRELGVDRPKKKPGPKPKPGLDALVIAVADDLKRGGSKGSAKWSQVHSHLDNREGLMGELLSVEPSALEQRYRRAKRRNPT
ncbi:hypothetical protein [Methylobacterium iners]|uniref:hypothetical protein n=1 Tax=Methylobacterium iners TaxID=418707 RepID=UPI001EE2AE15|nr:hypothetical protein [Methylobacterium iners]